MSEIISNSSLTISSITSEILASLTRIHADIDQHYTIISRISSAVTHVQGVLFFVALTLFTLLGCAVSERVRLRKNECLILISIHFLLEFFLSASIQTTIGVHWMRCMSILWLLLLVGTAKAPTSAFELILHKQLNSERLNRILERALKKEIYFDKLQRHQLDSYEIGVSKDPSS
jgi:hypothetical protein